MMDLVCSFESELRTVENQMSKEICFKSSTMEDLIDLSMNNLDRHLCPGIVLAVSSMTGQTGGRIISLASVFQYVFLAHYIHRLVTDEDMEERARQYPVLVGDFMFGQTFRKICDDDLFSYTGEFVRVIENINEGILLRWRLKNKSISLKDYRTILGKEKASLTALAAKLGGELAGLPEPCLRKIEDFGYSIGMAWAAWEEPIYTSLVQEYLAKAKGTILELREHLPVKPLQELYEFFHQEISPNAVLAGIK